ncbi:Netrin receptor unc5d [Cichlidogyrus casuarinus]|uniref:Netrin receptor unc5d n=1 Tax=Cichlidogyrus casuarinus TaxID=1844966 RepID=A0ABD2Q0E9_9PLAT
MLPSSLKSTHSSSLPADIKQNFRQEPTSNTDVLPGSQITLNCEPPTAQPKSLVKIYWLKDGVLVTKRSHPNIHIGTYDRLILNNASAHDSGNYTCVASLLDLELRQSTALIIIKGGADSNCFGDAGCVQRSREAGVSEYEKGKSSQLFKLPDSSTEEHESKGPSNMRDIIIYIGLFLALTVIIVFIVIALMVASRKQSRLHPRGFANGHNSTRSNLLAFIINDFPVDSLFGFPDKEALKYREQVNQNLMIVSNPLNVGEPGHSPNNGASNSSTNSSGAMLLPNAQDHDSMPTQQHMLFHANGLLKQIPCSANFVSPQMTPLMNQFVNNISSPGPFIPAAYHQNGLL